MRFREIFRFELWNQLRQVQTWLYFAVLLGLTFWIATDGYAETARSVGYFFNSPFSLAALTLLGSILALMIAAGLSGEAGARDAYTRMQPLVFTTPVEKTAYLGGRFLAAFLLNALVLTAVPIALLLAVRSAALPPELVGPFRPAAYIGAYLFIALPNAFVATAFQYSVATLSRWAMASYLGSLLVFFTTMFSWLFVAQRWGRWEIAKLLDPLGLTVMVELSRVLTPLERGTVLVGLEGSLLANRMVWIGIALGVLALTFRRFSFAHPVAGGWWNAPARRRGAHSSKADAAEDAPIHAAPIVVPRVVRSFGLLTRARQMLTIAWRSFLQIAIGWGGLPLVALAAVFFLTGAELMEFLGVPLFPTTERTTAIIGSNQYIFGLVVPLLVVFYAGELIWRERDVRVSEIIDAAPVPDWIFLLGKFVGLALVLALLQALMMAAAVALQVRLGYHEFQIGVYVQILFGILLTDYLLLAALALFVHVLVNQKYVGHMVLLVAYIVIAAAPALGIEHNLLVYGSDPGWEYSDIRGFGPFLGPWLWFKLYWAAWALLLAVAARLLWVRGRERGLRSRLRLARQRFTRPAILAGGAAVALIMTLGGFVFYNTNILNEYRTRNESRDLRAEYERRYGRYEGVPQPLLTGTRLHVEIHPHRRSVQIRGRYHLVNRGRAPIDTVHLAPATGVATGAVGFSRPATPVLVDEVVGHRIYALERPLHPGDSLQMDFEVRFEPRGFPNRGINAAVAANGTYLTNEEWLPAVGYQPERELGDAAERKARGLPPRPAFRSIDDLEARQDTAGQRRLRISFEAVVGTDDGQVVVAPGTLRRTWTEGGRRYFHYATDSPIRNDYALYSGDYAVREGRWRDVELQVVHHPEHAWTVDDMLASLRASLEYLTEELGPYPHGQLRLVERPRPGNITLSAEPINIWYTEGFSLLNPEDDWRGVNFPFAIVAHEVAHQWWGNQLIPANVEGEGLLSESLAWFSAMGVVEEAYGPEHLRRLIGVMQEFYLSPRARAGVPLLRAYDSFSAYRKGPFAMYALREYVGEERVNAALRRFFQEYASGDPPLPTSLDLYRELRAVTPDSLHSLLHDLFEANTYWEFAAEGAMAEPTDAGTWRVTLQGRARKVVVDTAGVETEIPMDDLVEIGVFAAGEDGASGEPLYLRMHRISSGEQQITVTVPREPARAGIDPRNLLIDVEPGDNLGDVRRAEIPPVRARVREGG